MTATPYLVKWVFWKQENRENAFNVVAALEGKSKGICSQLDQVVKLGNKLASLTGYEPILCKMYWSEISCIFFSLPFVAFRKLVDISYCF